MLKINILLLKSLAIIIIVTQIVLFFSSFPQFMVFITTPAQGWTNCTPVSGNTNQPLTNVDVSTSNSTFLPAFIQELIGMNVGQTKSFVIPPNQGYSTGTLAGQNLFFDVTITKIDSPSSGGSVVQNGYIVDLVYSLWINCPSQGTYTATQSNTGTNSASLLDNTPLYIGGGIILVGILAIIGYTVVRRSNISSSEKIQKNQTLKEQKNLKQIKNLIEQRKEISPTQGTTNTDDKHSLGTRPRRR